MMSKLIHLDDHTQWRESLYVVKNPVGFYSDWQRGEAVTPQAGDIVTTKNSGVLDWVTNYLPADLTTNTAGVVIKKVRVYDGNGAILLLESLQKPGSTARVMFDNRELFFKEAAEEWCVVEHGRGKNVTILYQGESLEAAVKAATDEQ
jgi:hypothetical protein